MNSSTKICPFCKNQIPINSEVCPVVTCKMVLIERFQSNNPKSIVNKSDSILNEKEPKLKSKPKLNPEQDYFDYIVSTRFDKYYNFIKDKFAFIFGAIIIVFFIFIFNNFNTDSDPQKTLYKNEVLDDLSHNNPKPIDPVTPISPKTFTKKKPIVNSPTTKKSNSNPVKSTKQLLPKKVIPEIYYVNGNVFDSDDYYLNGLGQLKIKNGTSNDAVAKLVNISTRKSVMTVYIRRNSNLTIDNIRDGYYRLYFVLGRRYDKEQSIFMENCSFSVFDDLFDFNTFSYNLSEGTETNYSVFEVTLHPVIGGTAKTNNVSKKEFLSF